MTVHSGGSAVSTHHLDGRDLSGRYGLLFWCAFAVVAVALRGVRWDEAYEHAQILAGQIPYPENHPLYRYVHNGFSAQTYLSALIVWLIPGPIVLNGLRNVLFVLASVLPAFLFTRKLTGESLWGHAAALLTLAGVWLEFDSSYPLSVWPNTFTNGYLGGGYMLLTMYLILTARWRSGLFLLGLAPAIHIGELPAILPVCGLFLLWTFVRGDRATLLRALPWGAAGVAICVGFGLLIRFGFYVPWPEVVADTASVDAIWKGYTEYFDPHRQFPPVNAHIGAVAALLIGIGAAMTLGVREPLWRWLAVYTASILAVVWVAMGIHAALGPETPFLVIGWMPYRLLNLLLPVWLATVIGVLARADDEVGGRIGGWMVGGALALYLALPVITLGLSDELVDRYLASGELVILLLTGAAYARLAGMIPARHGIGFAWRVAGGVGFVALIFVHQLGAASFAAGAALFVLFHVCFRLTIPARPRRSVLGTVIALAVLLTYAQFASREQLPLSSFDEQVARYLGERGERGAVLLAHPSEFLLQARVGNPVLVETQTASLMSYLPELGPWIQQTYLDLYGIRFDERPPHDVDARWRELWAARSAQEWAALARKYDIGYVIAPASVALDLEPAVKGETATLYRAGDLRFTAASD